MNIKKVTASAPGKLMLFGEHAIMYGSSCIVTAVDQRIFVSVEENNSGYLKIYAPSVDVKNYKKSLSELGDSDSPKGVRFLEASVKNFQSVFNEKIKGLTIETSADFSSSFGFGSSAASTVATVKALAVLYSREMTKKELFDLSYKSVLDVQKSGSGFDVASSIYGGTLYFVSGGKKIEPLPLSHLPLVVGYSGQKADTVSMMSQVSDRYKKENESTNTLFSDISHIVEEAKKALLAQDFEQVGILMNQNQECLEKLEVSTDMLDSMITSSMKHGAYGAKISGAGGGDCMIALPSVEFASEVEDAISAAGGEVLHVTTQAMGVRMESL